MQRDSSFLFLIIFRISKLFLNFQPKVALKAFGTGNLYIHSSLDLFSSHPDVMLFRIFKCGF